MKAEYNVISEVVYINEIFPICDDPQNMPVSLYIDELKEAVIQLSELMITLDKDDRLGVSEAMVKISSTGKMLSEMKQAVLKYTNK